MKDVLKYNNEFISLKGKPYSFMIDYDGILKDKKVAKGKKNVIKKILNMNSIINVYLKK